MDFEVEASPIGSGKSILIAIQGELDLASCERLKPAADEAVFGQRPLVLDLSKCTFIDSSGLRLILQIAKGLEEGDQPQPMAIVIGDSATEKLFSVTAIDQSIPLFDTREQAVDWIDAPR